MAPIAFGERGKKDEDMLAPAVRVLVKKMERQTVCSKLQRKTVGAEAAKENGGGGGCGQVKEGGSGQGKLGSGMNGGG